MAYKYFLLALVSVLAVQSEAKVVSTELFDGQELYALAKQGRISRECIEEVIAEIRELGKNVLAELRECGHEMHEIALQMIEKLIAETKENVDKINALLDELDACNDLGCLMNIGKQLVTEVIEAGTIARDIIAETVAHIKEELPELVDCAVNVHNANKGKVQEILAHLKECFAQ